PGGYLFDLIEDDMGGFWIPGQRGIHRLGRKELEAFFEGRTNRVRSLTLGVRDGLLTPDCTRLHYPITAKTPDGRIWIATRLGVAMVDPRRVEVDTQPLRAVIEQVRVNRREVQVHPGTSAREPLKLEPGSGQRLELEYDAISLLAADRLQFRYRLDGYDSEWSPATDLRQAFYTNLHPGNYRFRVQAANAHGIWNEEATAFHFSIDPYLWQRRTVQWSTIGGLLALAAGLHGWRLSAQRRAHEAKNDEALSAERGRIAADMHDELGAALTQISVLSEVAKTHSSGSHQIYTALDRISARVRDLTSRMGDLVWATNPRNETLDVVIDYLREQAASAFEGTDLVPRLEFPRRVPEWKVSATFRRNLLLVLKEALHNSLKHSGARSVELRLTVENRVLPVSRLAAGVGFDAASPRSRGSGLGHRGRRVGDLGGVFHVRSAVGRGTCIEFDLPLASPTFVGLSQPRPRRHGAIPDENESTCGPSGPRGG
ncbi:MAG: triple tyrosine motif-containing protein, partial [Limisphaerales bacterium]